MMFKLSTLVLAASLLGVAVASPTNSELESRATCQGNNSACGGPFPACCSGLFCNTLNGRCGPCMARNGACQLGVPCCAGLTCSALSGVSDYMHLLRGFPTEAGFTAMQLGAQGLQLYYCVTLICGATLLDASVRWDKKNDLCQTNRATRTGVCLYYTPGAKHFSLAIVLFVRRLIGRNTPPGFQLCSTPTQFNAHFRL
ncbi:hypothetical protein C8J57DRAFT_1248241 [Mycena rebaudengoi]|nr:hypothetical protein C8J57DRAFT_1248241 [Mycena rebaudengoi]